MKHAAVNAGVGTLGKHTLLLNKEYGNRLVIGAVLTNLDLPSDPLVESICIKGCPKCIENCPAQAIQDGKVNQKRCRIICPMQFGGGGRKRKKTPIVAFFVSLYMIQ